MSAVTRTRARTSKADPMTHLLKHLRRNVVAYLALLVALTTGTAYAAEELPKKLPKHSVGAKQLKKNAVSTDKVKDGSLTGADVQDGSLGLTDLSAAAVPGIGTLSM